MIQGKLIYTSESGKFCIYRNENHIILSGTKNNELLQTFKINVINEELELSNDGFEITMVLSIITLISLIYFIFLHITGASLFSLGDFISIPIAALMLIGLHWFGMNYGFLKFSQNQKFKLLISKNEFEALSAILMNEYKDEI